MSYNPPFEVNNEISFLATQITGLSERVSDSSNLSKNPRLRRKNRIKTIHGSLAIENNSLSVEQVTAVLDGKAVLAPPKDIEEVKNAFEIYELLDTLNPGSEADLLKSHRVLMRGLVDEAGEYRTKPVGVVDSGSGEIIHFGALPSVVPKLMEELLEWINESDLHPLIKSCVFHYEFEVIHPFLDGNGRMGRLWHTLILSKWNPIFAYIPVESLVFKNQEEYYRVISLCDDKANSTEFIVFMLKLIKQALEEILTAL
ncbi:MAG: Fic family protein [Eubacterium sp.]|nr:Fic family protein [Eubacterium sp.]